MFIIWFLSCLVVFALPYDAVSFEPLTSQTILQSYSPNNCNSKCALSRYIDKSNENKQYYWLTTSSSSNSTSTEWIIKNNIYSNNVLQYNNSLNQITNQLPYIMPTYLSSQNDSINELFSSCTSIVTNNTILCYTSTGPSILMYYIYCQIFDNKYLNGQWSSPIIVAQSINNYPFPFEVLCLNDIDNIGNYLVIMHDALHFYYTLLDSKGNIKQLQRLFFSPNITYQGKMDINYIAVECNPGNNMLLMTWMNIPDEHSIVLQKNVYGIFAKYDQDNNEMTILNNKSEEINMNSDFWCAYHPIYIELSEQNNCCFFMPYKELSELTNVGIGFLSIFNDNFDHMYHHSTRNNDDIHMGEPSLNVDYEIIDFTKLRTDNDVLNYFAVLYLVENEYFNGTAFNISVYSLDYINNVENKLEIIMDETTLITVNGDVEHLCVDLDVINNVLFISWIQYVYDDDGCKQDSATVVAQTWNVTLCD